MKNVLLILAVLLGVSICNSSSRLQAVTVPAGAAMRVRTIDPIDLNSARPGARFRGSLADPMKSRNGTVLIPREAKVELRAVNVARSLGMWRTRDRIDLKVDSVTFNGKIYPIVSTITKLRDGRKGSRTLRSTGSDAGAGAMIGGVPRGGPGAAIGPLVGGAGGTGMAASAANLRIPSETVLSFQLQRALRVN